MCNDFLPSFLHSLCLSWDNTKENVNVILVWKWFCSIQLHLKVAVHPVWSLFPSVLLKMVLFKHRSTLQTQHCFQLKLYCFTGSWNRPKNCNVFSLVEKKLLCCPLFYHPNTVLGNTITVKLLSNIYFYWGNSTPSVVAWCYHLIIFSFLLCDGKLQFNEVYI